MKKTVVHPKGISPPPDPDPGPHKTTRENLRSALEGEKQKGPAPDKILASEKAGGPRVNVFTASEPTPPALFRALAGHMKGLVTKDELDQLRAAQRKLDAFSARLNESGDDAAKAAWNEAREKFAQSGEDAVDGGQLFSLEEWKRDFFDRRAALRDARRDEGRKIGPLIEAIGRRYVERLPAIIEAIHQEETERFAAYGYAEFFTPSRLLRAVQSAAPRIEGMTRFNNPDAPGEPNTKLPFLDL